MLFWIFFIFAPPGTAGIGGAAGLLATRCRCRWVSLSNPGNGARLARNPGKPTQMASLAFFPTSSLTRTCQVFPQRFDAPSMVLLVIQKGKMTRCSFCDKLENPQKRRKKKKKIDSTLYSLEFQSRWTRDRDKLLCRKAELNRYGEGFLVFALRFQRGGRYAPKSGKKSCLR